MLDANTVYWGDNLNLLPQLDGDSIDSIVTDPPYGLSFMGKKWDYQVPGVEVWGECLRVLKPGGHLLSFFGSRTYHRGVVQIEDAGFEIRDQIMWVYGSGFPKSLDVGKAIDKKLGVEREVVGEGPYATRRPNADHNIQGLTFADDSYIRPAGDLITAPASPQAQQWDGWGTALKPAHEPIVVARKPLIGTVAENVMEWGTGGLNVDGCRVATGDSLNGGAYAKIGNRQPMSGDERDGAALGMFQADKVSSEQYEQPQGRWPANLIHDGSEEATSDMGSSSRYFYAAKASKSERNSGLPAGLTNNHPTVKPLSLMRYLCRLITPPNGLLLDPFAGSGTTLIAAREEGFDYIGIELDVEYVQLAQQRLTQEIEY